MSIVQLFPNGGGGADSFIPGSLTTYPANVVPYINGAQESAYDANFTYQSTNLGIGLSSALGARLHVKGANDSGSSFAARIQSATYNILQIENSRHILIGPGSKAANTEYTINAFGAGAADTDITFQIVGTSSDNILRVYNGYNYTNGGVHILRESATSRIALKVGSTVSGNAYFGAMSSGVVHWGVTGATSSEFGTGASQMGFNSSLNAMVHNIYNDIPLGYIFTKRIGLTALQSGSFFALRVTFGGANQTGSHSVFTADSTYNYTGTGTYDIRGIDYNPTVTALTGTHYGALIRSGKIGFNLGSTMPTAMLHLGAGTTAAATAALKFTDGVLNTTPEDGAIERATHLYHTKGTYRYQIDPDYDGTPDTDHSAVGHTTNTFNAGATITVMDLCYLGSSSKWLLTDSDAEATSIGMLAISLESKTDTQAMRVALPGSYVRDDSWNWTPGAQLYVDNATPGAITATAPVGAGDVVRVVGWAQTADVIYFNPSTEYSVI